MGLSGMLRAAGAALLGAAILATTTTARFRPSPSYASILTLASGITCLP